MTCGNGGWKCAATGVGLTVLLGTMLSWAGLLVAVTTSPSITSNGGHVLALAEFGLVTLAILGVLLILLPSWFAAGSGTERRLATQIGLALSGFWLLSQGGLFLAAASVAFYRETIASPQYVTGELFGFDLGYGLLLLGVGIGLLAVSYLAWSGLLKTARGQAEAGAGSKPKAEAVD